jgi:hypothetical protein
MLQDNISHTYVEEHTSAYQSGSIQRTDHTGWVDGLAVSSLPSLKAPKA